MCIRRAIGNYSCYFECLVDKRHPKSFPDNIRPFKILLSQWFGQYSLIWVRKNIFLVSENSPAGGATWSRPTSNPSLAPGAVPKVTWRTMPPLVKLRGTCQTPVVTSCPQSTTGRRLNRAGKNSRNSITHRMSLFQHQHFLRTYKSPMKKYGET